MNAVLAGPQRPITNPKTSGNSKIDLKAIEQWQEGDLEESAKSWRRP